MNRLSMEMTVEAKLKDFRDSSVRISEIRHVRVVERHVRVVEHEPWARSRDQYDRDDHTTPGQAYPDHTTLGTPLPTAHAEHRHRYTDGY